LSSDSSWRSREGQRTSGSLAEVALLFNATHLFAELTEILTLRRRERLARPARARAVPGDVAAKVTFVTVYHLILEATAGLRTFEFASRFLQCERLLPGFVAGYRRIHRDEHHRIGSGVWFLRKTVACDDRLGDVVGETLRALLPPRRRLADAAGGAPRYPYSELRPRNCAPSRAMPDAPAERHRRCARLPVRID
jgi:hypothetical protein